MKGCDDEFEKCMKDICTSKYREKMQRTQKQFCL